MSSALLSLDGFLSAEVAVGGASTALRHSGLTGLEGALVIFCVEFLVFLQLKFVRQPHDAK